MADVKQKVEHALNEGRILILGAEVLLGFQYRAVFETGFEKLPPPVQYLKVGGLGLLLVALALLIWPATYHQLVEDGKATRQLTGFISKVMGFALLPFALGLGIDVYVAFQRVLGEPIGIAVGVSAVAAALFFWYGLELLARSRIPRRKDEEVTKMLQEDKNEETKLPEKIKNVLTEIRMVLPGAQALLGFQFATMLVDGFEKLPVSSKYVHLGSLAVIALAIVLLMTPSAYHRIVEEGEDTPRFYRFSSLMLMAAMVFLSVGIVGDLYVVVHKVFDSQSLAIGASLFFLALFLGLWFGYSFYRRSERSRKKALQLVTGESQVKPEIQHRDAA